MDAEARRAKPFVSVVIVNWNGLDHTPGCVASVLASTYDAMEVVVVDNASTDGSVEAIASRFPEVRIVQTGGNVGFGPAVMRALPHLKGDHFLVLNNDIEVESDCIAHLVEAAQQGYAAVAALIVLRDRPGRVNGAGGQMHYLGLGWPRHYEAPIEAVAPQLHEVTFCAGGVTLYERRAFEEVGGFDDDFFLYVEDADLSWRLRLAGHRTALEPRARMVHDWDFSRHKRKFYLIERNRVLMLAKDWSIRAQLVLLPAIVVYELAALAGAWSGGWGRLKLAAWRDAARGLPRAWRAGRRVVRRRHEAEVARAFEGGLDHPTLRGWPVRFILAPLLRAYWAIARPLLRLVGARAKDSRVQKRS